MIGRKGKNSILEKAKTGLYATPLRQPARQGTGAHQPADSLLRKRKTHSR